MAAEKTKKRPRLFRRAVLLSLLAAAAAAALTWLAVARLEQGVLDVCAVQQDAYVQLVLDQIELQQDRVDRDIIDGILGTLDGSSSKYWVFSKGETMLFVKDVVETNKYKGFTTATYYDSVSAREFLDSLRQNHVSHAAIAINGQPYIASGAVFSYAGAEYRLCLLTNRSVMLENNAYLRVKSELWAVVLALLLLLAAIPAYYAKRADTMARRALEAEETVAMLRRNLAAMNDRLANRDWYDPETSLWQGSVLPRFIERAAGRRFTCAVLARVHCEREEDRLLFLRAGRMSLPKSTLRFEWGERDLVLLFLNVEEPEAFRAIAPLLGEHAALVGSLAAAHTPQELRAAAARLTPPEGGFEAWQ